MSTSSSEDTPSATTATSTRRPTSTCGWRPTPENARRVAEALEDFGFGVPELDPDLFLKSDSLVRMGVPPFRIELQTSISGVDFDACWAARVEDEWDGVPVHVIGLEHLKQNKRASGRPKDLADLDYLP